MSLVTHISGRFLRTPGSRLLSLITIFAGVGVILGVMVLDVTLAVMNGFRDQVQMTFVENMPMVTVLNRQNGFAGEVDSMTTRLAADPEVLGAAPFQRVEGLVSYSRLGGRERTQTMVLWGIDPELQPGVTRVAELAYPDFTDFSTDDFKGGGPGVPGLLLGSVLAGQLNVFVGDKVAVHLPRRMGTGTLDFEAETREFIVVGLVKSGMYDFDTTFAWAELGVVQEIRATESVVGIGLKVRDMRKAPLIADRLEHELGFPRYHATDWISMNTELFKWMQYEKLLMFLLLTFLIVIASLNVVALLVMMVRDRRREIGVLMSLGAEPGQIAGIFLRLGLSISLTGTLVGTVLGYLVTLALDRIGYELPGDVLFVEVLPVHAKLGDFALVAGVTLGLSALVSLLPAFLATRQSPVEVLRHE
ncbi:hypothetical protein DRQ53_01255 [bacterium]|nr:MAG: hypothetical protein DRQ53_01255 [bacterium]